MNLFLPQNDDNGARQIIGPWCSLWGRRPQLSPKNGERVLKTTVKKEPRGKKNNRETLRKSERNESQSIVSSHSSVWQHSVLYGKEDTNFSGKQWICWSGGGWWGLFRLLHYNSNILKCLKVFFKVEKFLVGFLASALGFWFVSMCPCATRGQ